MTLVSEVYKITRVFPKDEMYALTSQIRRCVVSIPSNIAEGYSRNSTSDYIRFLRIALSSLYELQTQVEIGLNLKYIDKVIFDMLYDLTRELERMLSVMIDKIEKK